MTSVVKDYVKLHFIIFIWGFTAILGVLITLPAVEIVLYRTLIATVSLAGLMYLRKRSFAIGFKPILKIIGVGFLISAHWILFFWAAQVANVSVCLAAMATCAFWTSLIEPLFNQKRVKGYEIILGLTVILGLYIIFKFEFDYALGLVMALVSAILASFFSVINGQLSTKYNAYMITFYEMLGACVGTALFLPFYALYFTDGVGVQLVPTAMDWVYLAVLALICTVYAFSVSVELMKRLTVFAINLSINMEPVYGILIALVVFGEKEKMGGGFYLGASVILASVLAYPLVNRWLRIYTKP